MEYICFKCKNSLGSDVRAFFSHLRVVDHVYSTSTYFQCAQAGCNRTFSIIRSFRRHLLEHANEIGNEMEESLWLSLKTINQIQKLLNRVMRNVMKFLMNNVMSLRRKI